MKRKGFLLALAVSLLSFSCSDDIEKGVDCVTESVLVQMHHTVDASNPKKVDFQVTYSGTYAVSSVRWTFGDGATEVVNGKTTSHTYTTAGTYEVKAEVTIAEGKSECTSSHTKSITVN